MYNSSYNPNWASPTTGIAEELRDIAGVRPAAAQAKAALENQKKTQETCMFVIIQGTIGCTPNSVPMVLILGDCHP